MTKYVGSWVNLDGETVVVVGEHLPKVPVSERDNRYPYSKERLRKRVWEKDKGVCQCCGKKADFETFNVDHRKAHSSGGETTYENAQVTHPECNNSKRDRSDRKYGTNHDGSTNWKEQVTKDAGESLAETLVEEVVKDLYKNVLKPGVRWVVSRVKH